ncbi:MAG: CDP-alcohol phosphatidyltransferase family protein [Anaerolineae bacterium]|nr:CDP-alcohol phosphatidyltransferase family protein [Anaerolineae bacterium]
MLDILLRETKDWFLMPLAGRLRPIHPIPITFIGLAFGLLAGWLIFQQQYGWGLVAWWLNRLFDGLDGTVARVTHKQSDLGGYLDILFDFVVYALIPISLVLSAPSPATYLALTLLLAMFYINAASWMYLSALLEKRAQGAKARGERTSVTMPAGLIGGAETIIFFSLFILLPQQIIYLFSLMAILVVFTMAQRIVWAVRHLD